jgi:S1-C subfamily serine protease
MHRTALALAAAVLAGPCLAADGPRNEVQAIEEAMQDLIRRAEPAVACVLVSRSDAYRQFGALPSADSPGKLGSFDGAGLLRATRPFDQTRIDLIKRLDLADPDHVPESFGSGVLIDEGGLVLTCYHVVRDATKVYVRLPGGHGSYADVHAGDPRSDLAVLKMLTPPRNVKALKPGRGEDVRKGQFVVALSNPYAAGFRDGSPSASWGIISGLRRRAPGGQREEERTKTLHHYGTLVQTDTRLNLGCSGGALVNLKGEFVALTSALAALTGTDTPGGFAVPMTAGMRRIIDRLKEGREVEYGFLGVSFELTPPGGSDGIRILNVSQGSPAAEAGLKPETWIVRVDDQPVRDTDELFLAIGTALAGSKLKLEIATTRGGPTREHVAELAKFYLPGKFVAAVQPPAVGGLRVDYTSTLLRAGGDRPILKGVVVREVLPGSPAEKANLTADRVITKVNGRPVTTPAEYYQEVRNAAGAIELTFSNDETVKVPIR